MDEVQWLDGRELRAWRSLQFMQMRLEGELARQLAADSALSYPDYLVLVALFRVLVKRAFHRRHYGESWADELVFLFTGYGVDGYLEQRSL